MYVLADLLVLNLCFSESLLTSVSFPLGKKVGEEAVSLNPTCADSHQWYVYVVSFLTRVIIQKLLVLPSFQMPCQKQINQGNSEIRSDGV